MLIKEESADDENKDGRISIYTCHVTPLPEEHNLSFSSPEFMICYRSPSDDGSNPEKVKYFCSPVKIRAIDEEKGIFEVQIIQEENKEKLSEKDSENLPNQNSAEKNDSQNEYVTGSYYLGQPIYCNANPNQFCGYQQSMHPHAYLYFHRNYCPNFYSNFTSNNHVDGTNNAYSNGFWKTNSEATSK